MDTLIFKELHWMTLTNVFFWFANSREPLYSPYYLLPTI
jgi:hypothetical protein